MVILALHDLNLAAAFAHRLVLLHRGRVVACGPPREVLTPRMLRETFGVEALVRVHPLTGRVCVHFPCSTPQPRAKRGRVLVVEGGGSVEDLLPLPDAKYEATLGAVAPLDADYQLMQALGIPGIMEAPFSPVSEATYHERCQALAAAQAMGILGPLGSARGTYGFGRPWWPMLPPGRCSL